MLWNQRWNPMSEKFNQQIIPLINNFIIAFEEILIFKFYYQHDNKKPEELPPEEMREQMSLYQRLFCQKTKNSAEYQEALRQSQTKHFWKETATGTVKKSRRGHKWRTTKRYEKIQKGFKGRVYSILPICIFLGVLFSEKWNNSF